jgi:hypothetical protein
MLSDIRAHSIKRWVLVRLPARPSPRIHPRRNIGKKRAEGTSLVGHLRWDDVVENSFHKRVSWLRSLRGGGSHFLLEFKRRVLKGHLVR